MTWGESRARRQWQRELEAQIRALPTSDADTPDGGPVEPLPAWTDPAPARRRAPRPPSGERRRTVVTVGVTLAVIVAVLGGSLTPAADAIRGLVGWEGDRGDESTYAFLNTRPGTGEPVTWSSCRPIRYVVNPTGAPSGWESTLEEAADAITEASGLELAAEGTSDERPGESRRDAFGRPEPVLIAWATPDEVPQLDGDTVGLAGPQGTRRGYDTGNVTFDAEAFARMESEGAEGRQLAIMMHELAHLVGLDHVDDERQLMYPTTTRQASFGNGDLEGLRRLGSGPC